MSIARTFFSSCRLCYVSWLGSIAMVKFDPIFNSFSKCANSAKILEQQFLWKILGEAGFEPTIFWSRADLANDKSSTTALIANKLKPLNHIFGIIIHFLLFLRQQIFWQFLSQNILCHKKTCQAAEKNNAVSILLSPNKW